MFSYNIIEGDKGSLFKNKNDVVISEELAKKFFESPENAIGKTIICESSRNKNDVTVVGVFEDLVQSSIEFDFILGHELFIDVLGEKAHWGNFFTQATIVLDENADPQKVEAKIAGYLKTKSEGRMNYYYSPFPIGMNMLGWEGRLFDLNLINYRIA